MANRKPILSLDFDGVCHSYTTKWQGAHIIPDPPVDGLWDFLREAIKHFEVNIFSTRNHHDGGIAAMAKWFANHAPLDFPLYKLVYPLTKPPATVGIDDRQILFEGKFPDIEYLKTFKPWNKRGI